MLRRRHVDTRRAAEKKRNLNKCRKTKSYQPCFEDQRVDKVFSKRFALEKLGFGREHPANKMRTLYANGLITSGVKLFRLFWIHSIVSPTPVDQLR